MAALAVAIFASRFVSQQFFPNSSRPELVVELRLKEGASFAATTEQVKKMESVLAKDEDIRFFTAYTGAGQPRFYLSLNPELPNPGYAVFIVMTKDMEARERVRSRLMASVDQQFPQMWVRVTRLELGPPVGFPVQFRVVGPDTQKVREIAREVEHVVASSPKVRDVQLDWNDPVRTLKVDLDQDKARALGLAPADVALVTQIVMNGATLSHLREREDLIDIVARAVPSERLDLDTLKDVNLFTRDATVVPLSQVARVSYELEEPVLWRRNRDMAITVRADVKDGEQGVTVTQSIRPLLHDIEAKLPFGYRIDVAGAVEESDKANSALMAIFPVMLVVILTILMLQLQSFSLMFMVFLTAPLGLIGVVAALLLFNAPLGFVAILGVTALSGMIMRNAVILIDQVKAEIAEGRDIWNAVVEAAVHRTRPVALTAAATVLAMVPLTRSVFWGPMAIAIMGGLTIATLLTIFFVPALYAAWFKVQRDAAVDAAPATAVPAAGSLNQHDRERRIEIRKEDCRWRPRMPARRLRDACVDANACGLYRSEREAAVRRHVARFSAVRARSALPYRSRAGGRHRRLPVFGRALAFHCVRVDRDRVHGSQDSQARRNRGARSLPRDTVPAHRGA